MDTQSPLPLDELARRDREALAGALEEMVESGFGEFDGEPSAPERPDEAAAMGWW